MTARIAGAALAGLLALQGSAAAAAPVSVWQLIGEVLHGYEAVVEVKLDPEPAAAPVEAGAPPLAVRLVELARKGDPAQALRIPVTEGRVTEADVGTVVDWLAPLPSDSRAETLSALVFYTKPSDADAVNAFLGTLGLMQFGVGDQRVGFFSSGGKQVSEIDGGTDASAGQVLDAATEAVI